MKDETLTRLESEVCNLFDLMAELRANREAMIELERTRNETTRLDTEKVD